jgi:hypothetical protein
MSGRLLFKVGDKVQLRNNKAYGFTRKLAKTSVVIEVIKVREDELIAAGHPQRLKLNNHVGVISGWFYELVGEVNLNKRLIEAMKRLID